VLKVDSGLLKSEMRGDWTLPLQRRTFKATVPPDVKGLP
jgi:hypothetical protein